MDAMIQSDREFFGSKLRHRIRHVWFLFSGDGFFQVSFVFTVAIPVVTQRIL